MYEKARSYRDKSGSSMEVVIEMCPYFDDLDSFLGVKPLSKPHYRETSVDTPEPTDPAEPSGCQDEDLSQDNTQEPLNLQDSPVFDSSKARQEVDETHSQEDLVPPTQYPPAKKRIKLASPGGVKRSRKRTSCSVTVSEDLQEFMADEAKFMERQEDMWNKQMKLQEKQIQEREKDRELLHNIIEMQAQESKEMTAMFGELVGILKTKSTNQTVPAPAPAPAPSPSPAASNYPYQSQDLSYAGVGGGAQNIYDMSHSYLQFHEL